VTTKSSQLAGEAAPSEAKAPSPLRSAGALHKAMHDGSPMECGGNDAALAGHALSPMPEDALNPVQEGELPEGWQHQQLDELCGLVSDQIQPSAAAGLPYVGLEHVDSGEPTLRRWGDPEDVRSAKTRFAPGDILYGKLRPYLDKSVLAPFAGICSTDILVLRAQADRAIAEFLVSAIHTKPFLEHAVSTTGGVNHPRTSWNALKVHALPVPLIPEQRGIAAVLRTVQGAKEACERVLAATRQLKQGLLHHLFTYGPVPFPHAAHVLLQETEMGSFPETWRQVSLGELCADNDGTIQTGPFGSQLHKSDYVDDGVPVVNPTHLLGNRINHSDVPTITQAKAAELSRHRLRVGDVLFARRGEIGRHGFVTQAEDGWQCGTGCFLVRVQNAEVFNAFLPWYFSRGAVV